MQASILQKSTIKCNSESLSKVQFIILQHTKVPCTVACRILQCSAVTKSMKYFSAVKYPRMSNTTVQYSRVQNTTVQLSSSELSTLKCNVEQQSKVYISAVHNRVYTFASNVSQVAPSPVILSQKQTALHYRHCTTLSALY